jgi:hypothetical protein
MEFGWIFRIGDGSWADASLGFAEAVMTEARVGIGTLPHVLRAFTGFCWTNRSRNKVQA